MIIGIYIAHAIVLSMNSVRVILKNCRSGISHVKASMEEPHSFSYVRKSYT